jgi:hypothetical protein
MSEEVQKNAVVGDGEADNPQSPWPRINSAIGTLRGKKFDLERLIKEYEAALRDASKRLSDHQRDMVEIDAALALLEAGGVDG